MALRIAHSLLVVTLFASVPCARSDEHASSSAHANTNVHQLLFEDCEAARKEFLTLPASEQQKTFDYLTRVVSLNTQAPKSPEAFAVMPGTQSGVPTGIRQNLDVLAGPALWQNTDAKRELRAKRCALELLLSAGASALPSIPSLITIYSEQSLSDEIAVAVEETAANIAESAHKAGMTPNDGDFAGALPYLLGPRPLLAQNLFGEYPIVAVPQLVRFLAGVEDTHVPRVQELLQQLDRDGSRTMRAFVDNAPQFSAERLEVVASRITLPTAEVLQPYLPEILRLAAMPERTNSLTPLLGRLCRAFNGALQIDPTITPTLARQIQVVSDSRLSQDEKKCLLAAIPPLAVRAGMEVLASDEQIVAQAIRLLEPTVPHLVGENRAIVANRLRELAVKESSPLAPTALLGLTFFPEKKADALAVVATVLKTIGNSASDTTGHTALAEAAFTTASSLASTKDVTRFTPALVKAVATGVGFDAARPLAKQHPAFEMELTKLLSINSPDTTRRALTALTDRATLGAKTAAPLIELLKSGVHGKLVMQVLALVGRSSAPAIRRALPKPSTPRKILGLSTLTLLQVATKQELQELASLISSAECASLPPNAAVIGSLLSSKELDEQPRTLVRVKVAQCLPFLDKESATAVLQQQAALLLPACGDMAPHVGSSTLPTEVTKALVIMAEPHAECSLILERALLHEPREIKMEVLERLDKSITVSASVLTAVRDGALTTDSDKPLFYAAARVVAKHAPLTYDWSPIIAEAIAAAGRGDPISHLLEITRYLDPAKVLEEVTPALDSESPERVVGACHVGASLGPQAVPIVSKLWHLREKRVPSIRYAAALALLEVNPLTPELQDALRQLLVNRYHAWAVGRPIRWQQTVAFVELPKAELGTLRTTRLEQLLLRAPNAAPVR